MKKSIKILLSSLLTVSFLAACTNDEQPKKEEEKDITSIGNQELNKEDEIKEEEVVVPNGKMLYETEKVLSDDDYLKVSYKGVRTFVDENARNKYGFTEEEARIYEVLLYVENKTKEDIKLIGGETLKIDDKIYDSVTYFFEDTINALTKREVSVLLLSYGGEIVQVDIDNMKNISLDYKIVPFYDTEKIYEEYKHTIKVGTKNEENIQLVKESLAKGKAEREAYELEQKRLLELNIEEDTESKNEDVQIEDTDK